MLLMAPGADDLERLAPRCSSLRLFASVLRRTCPIQYGRPRYCAAVVPTQPPALANCGRLSTYGSGKIQHLPGNPPLLPAPTVAGGRRRRDTYRMMAELRKPLRVILDIARKMCRVIPLS